MVNFLPFLVAVQILGDLPSSSSGSSNDGSSSILCHKTTGSGPPLW